jgi:hypothetical protein
MQRHRAIGGLALAAVLFSATLSFGQSTASSIDSPKPQTMEIASANGHDAQLINFTSAEPRLALTSSAAAMPMVAPIALISTPTPVIVKRTESERQKKIWYALTIANHSAVAFDAYSTRYAVSRGAQELNPMLKPFASSGWIYPAMQVGAVGLDYVSHRMMRSKNPLLRKMWWLPQSANAVSSFAAGVHNMGVK